MEVLTNKIIELNISTLISSIIFKRESTKGGISPRPKDRTSLSDIENAFLFGNNPRLSRNPGTITIMLISTINKLIDMPSNGTHPNSSPTITKKISRKGNKKEITLQN